LAKRIKLKNKIIIVGGGLVGNIVAWQLYLKGIDFILFDEEVQSNSSKVAGGLYNPIVFKRFTQSWEANKLISYLDEYYSRIENKLNTKIHYKKDIYKLIANKDEAEFWEKKSKENSEFMDDNIYDLKLDDFIYENSGFGKVKQSGYLDTNLFINESKKYFTNINKYISQKLNSELINEYKINNKIIFCEGYKGINNLYFPNLKFNFAKGEILDLKIEGLNIDYIITKNIFILPLGNNIYRVGSTFEWDFKDDLPTEKQKINLIDNLKKILKVDFEIINHKAGIRPATYDRRPFVGKSKFEENIFILNGMGAKGVMIAPYTSEILINNIFNNIDIPDEINVKRCY